MCIHEIRALVLIESFTAQPEAPAKNKCRRLRLGGKQVGRIAGHWISIRFFVLLSVSTFSAGPATLDQ